MANQTVIFYYSWCSICQVKTNLVWALVNYIVLIVVFAVFPALYEMPPLTDRVYGKTNCKGSPTCYVFENVACGTCYPPRKKQILQPIINFPSKSFDILWYRLSQSERSLPRHFIKHSGGWGGGSQKKKLIGWDCATPLSKPLTYLPFLWPKSANFSTLFMTWPDIYY